MLKKLKNNKRGFTIIEVMIVLAVAALIILIVLLAVPALQRSSRNTTIKSDAASVASAISDYETNNSGKSPAVTATPDPLTGVVYVGPDAAGASPNSDNQVKIQGSTKVSNASALPVAAGGSADIVPGEVQVWSEHTCAGASNTRASAVYYVTEGGGDNTLQCIDT